MRSAPTLALVLGLLAAGCGTRESSASEPGARLEAETVSADPAPPAGQAFGAALSATALVPLAELFANPERYEGQVVRTSGPIRAVCRHRGCWMDIGAEAESDGRVHVRSLDHGLAFPSDAVGKIAEVEGEVQAMPGVASCSGHEGDSMPGCGMAAAGRRLQLAVRGAVIR
jgi:hypothetical protein